MGSVMRTRLKYLYPDKDRHGNTRYYVKRPGYPKIRLRAEPDTQAFMDAYFAALEGRDVSKPQASAPAKPKPSTGTLSWLIQRYYESPEFTRLADSTRYVRRKIFDRIEAKSGQAPFRQLTPQTIRKGRDKRAEQPESANGFVKALRQLFKWAVDAGYADRNPAAEVPLISTNSDGFHTWSVAEVDQFVRQHPRGTKAYLALTLMLFTGVRRSDAVKIGRQMIRDGWLYFTETKGQSRKAKHRAVPIMPELQDAIDAAGAHNMTLLVTEYGKPFTAAGFGNWFRKRCDEAGLKHCSAHGLRKAGATIAAENGATEKQLMAMFGWDDPAQAAHYTKKANARKLAGEGMPLIRLTRTDQGQEFPTDAEGDPEVGKNGGKKRGKSGA